MPGELLVKYKNSASVQKHSTARNKAKLIKPFKALGIERWVLSKNQKLNDVLQQLKSNPDVEIVEPNYRRYPRAIRAAASNYPNNSSRLQQAGLTSLWGKSVVNGAPKVKIAVFDDGFDIDHEDLAANIVDSFDALDNDNNARPEICVDENGQFIPDDNGDPFTEHHGTEVLGVVGAVRNNGIGIDGASDNAELYPVRLGCNYTVAAELAAVDWAIQKGVDIVSISYGGPMYSELERVAFQKLVTENILVVAAAGNDDVDNDRIIDYPSGLDLPNVFTIAGTNGANELAEWSQWGQTTVDLAAPGENFATTNLSSGLQKYVQSVSGTSFSSPMVAGVLASLMTRDPIQSDVIPPVYRARAALMLAAKRFSVTSKAKLAGDGYIDANAAWSELNSLQPVIVVKSIKIDDSENGNNNGEVDPGESIKLRLQLENQGTDADYFQATVESSDIPMTSYSFEDSLKGFTPATHSYVSREYTIPVDFGDVTQQQDILFSVTILGDYSGGSFSTTRYFTLDTGSLESGAPVESSIRKNDDNQDELHFYHIDVPTGMKSLTIRLNPSLNGASHDL
ncbi:MAG: S8 family serine peptidase, partial [Gammaproteobacteria bacterium]|nr:S8 family serine peptidase [Gammaproteobacteria bacterium]